MYKKRLVVFLAEHIIWIVSYSPMSTCPMKLSVILRPLEALKSGPINSKNNQLMYYVLFTVKEKQRV